MFVAERGLAIEVKTVDLFTGEHFDEEFSALNPRAHAWLARMKRSPYWPPRYAPIEGVMATLPRTEAATV